jgi:hypothetical protein
MTRQHVSDGVPELTSQDIVKLFAVTYLPLCDALEKAGVISKTDLAAHVLALSAGQEPAAWAQVAVALATVLQRPVEADTAAPTGSANLTLITGGKTS